MTEYHVVALPVEGTAIVEDKNPLAIYETYGGAIADANSRNESRTSVYSPVHLVIPREVEDFDD